jgi:hypothetical protein
MSFKRDVVLMRKHSICRNATTIKNNENSPHHIFDCDANHCSRFIGPLGAVITLYMSCQSSVVINHTLIFFFHSHTTTTTFSVTVNGNAVPCQANSRRRCVNVAMTIVTLLCSALPAGVVCSVCPVPPRYTPYTKYIRDMRFNFMK